MCLYLREGEGICECTKTRFYDFKLLRTHHHLDVISQDSKVVDRHFLFQPKIIEGINKRKSMITFSAFLNVKSRFSEEFYDLVPDIKNTIRSNNNYY